MPKDPFHGVAGADICNTRQTRSLAANGEIPARLVLEPVRSALSAAGLHLSDAASNAGGRLT